MKPHPLLPWIICILGSFFYVFDYFLAVAPSVITQDLMHDFALNAATLGGLMAVFSMASSVFQIPAGMLLDRFGARRLLSLSVLISGLGALLFSFAHAGWQLALARFCMGIGSPFAFLGALYLVSRWFEHRHFGLASGAIQLGAAAGSMIGGAPLALLVEHLGWRSALQDIGIGTILLSVLFWKVLRDGKPSHSPAAAPLSLRATFAHPQVWLITLIGFCSWVTVTGLGSLWGIPYLMQIYHWSTAQAGSLYLLFWAGLGLGSPLVGTLSDRIHSRKIPFFVCFVIGGMATLLYQTGPALSVGAMGLVLFGLGFVASVQSLTFAAAKDVVPASHFVAISGLINLAAVMTGFVMQPLMGKLMDLHATTPGHYSLADYQFSLWPIVIFLGVGAVVSLLLKRRQELL